MCLVVVFVIEMAWAIEFFVHITTILHFARRQVIQKSVINILLLFILILTIQSFDEQSLGFQ